MQKNLIRPKLITTALLFLASATWAQTVTVTQTHPTGVYAPGETVTWRIEAAGDSVAQLTNVSYSIKQNLLTPLSEGTVDLSKGPIELSGSIAMPGTIGVSFKFKPEDKLTKWVAGAIYAPAAIKPTAPPPDDFDAFWKANVAAAEAVALSPQVETEKSEKPGIDVFKVRLDNVAGTHVYGRLAKPQREGKFPAVVIFQAAGVGALPTYNVLPRASQGYLAFNIMAHDLPMDQPPEFYKTANETTHKNYIQLGNDDRETSYFLRMYLACYQAVRYVQSRDDWDGKTLIVMGTSQGGMQALAVAGLHPGVTAVIANVPAGCDATGSMNGRMTGFPYWRGWGREPNKATIEVGRYFDAVNFARRIKAPALVAFGLIDEACPAAGVVSAFNEIPGTKERLIMAAADHHGSNKSHADFYTQSEAWLGALGKGKPLPAPKQPQD